MNTNINKKGMKQTILVLFLILCSLSMDGAVIRFIAIVYDQVTFQPVTGKAVEFELFSLTFNQSIHQQQFTTSASGEVITQNYIIADSTVNVYTFRINDCNSNTVEFPDTFTAAGNDTVFLFLGICHTVALGQCKSGFKWFSDTANPLIIHFQDSSTGNGLTYLWSFGDGTVSGLQNPVKHYMGPGAYLVCLTVTDTASSCTNTSYDVVSIIQGASVNADFSAVIDSFAVSPRIVRFTDESNSNVWLNQYLWSFGDGNISQVINPVHQYSQSGQFLTCLKTGYAGGLYDTLCKTITIPDYYDMWGQLFYDGIPLDGGKVQLINPVGKDSGYAILDDVEVISPGFYFFAQRIEHNYLLRAFPDTTNASTIIPTYTGNTIFWKKAALVSLHNDITNLDISLVKKDDAGSGTCVVNGNVWYSIDKPDADALILLLDYVTSKPVAFTYSGLAGDYFMQGIPYGKYRLVAEVPGLESSETIIELSLQNTTMSGMNIYLSKTIFIENNSLKSNDFRLYPNPAFDFINIESSGVGKPIEVVIHNISGSEMLIQKECFNDSPQHTLDIRALPAGIYLISVKTTAGTAVRKFVIGK